MQQQLVISLEIKIVDKITSAGMSKEDDKTKKVEEIYIQPEKKQQIIEGLKLL